MLALPNDRSRGKAMVAAAAILWDSGRSYFKTPGSAVCPPASVVLVAMSVPAPFLLRGQWRDTGATLAFLLVALGDAGSIGILLRSHNAGPVAVAVVTHYVAPILVAMTAPVVLGERRSRAALIATLCLLPDWRCSYGATVSNCRNDGAHGLGKRGLLHGGRVRGKKSVTSVQADGSYHPARPDFGANCSGMFWRGSASRRHEPRRLACCRGGAVCGIGGSLLFYCGLRRIPAQVAGALSYIEPLVGTLLAVAVLGESIGPLGIAGAAIVLGSGVWVALAKLPPASALAEAAGGRSDDTASSCGSDEQTMTCHV